MVRNQAGLYLDFDVSQACADQASAALDAVLSCAMGQSLLIRTGASRSLPGLDLNQMVKSVQRAGVAVLVEGDVRRATMLGADGIHLPWSKDVLALFKDARRAGGSGTIIGADAGRSRHDAMEIGEAGADYVAFGIPDHVEDRERACDRQIEHVAWWNEIFEIPCVAFDVENARHALALAEAGADFIAVRLTADAAIDAITSRLREFDAVVRSGESVS